MKKVLSIAALIFLGTYYLNANNPVHNNNKMYFCTAADERYFPVAMNLIASIHMSNYYDTQEIAVFNIGLSPKQIEKLNQIDKVKVYKVELTHPDLLKHFKTKPLNTQIGSGDGFIWSPAGLGKPVRGWFAWKPVVLKQALDMFPYVVFFDAGVTVLRPLQKLFYHIRKHGYYFEGPTDTPNIVGAPKFVREKFGIAHDGTNSMKGKGIFISSILGASHKIYDSFVLPMYEYSKDLRYFADDGSVLGGFGKAGHDQTLFNVQAQLIGLTISPPIGKDAPINVAESIGHISPSTHVYHSRWHTYLPYYKKFIRSKKFFGNYYHETNLKDEDKSLLRKYAGKAKLLVNTMLIKIISFFTTRDQKV